MCLGVTLCRCGGDGGEGKAASRRSDRCAKILYMMLFLGGAVLTLVMRFWGDRIFPGLYSFEDCAEHGRCYGVTASYRVSFAFFVFFLLMAGISAVSFDAHRGWWTLKSVGLLALVALSMLIPNDFFYGYRWVALVGSVLFILIQILVLLDFAFDVHEFLLKRMDSYREECVAAGREEPGVCQNGWAAAYIGTTITLLIVSLAGIIIMFAITPAGPNCGANIAILAETLILGVICQAVSMLESVGQGALPPAVVWIYCVFLAYGAITNQPIPECNPSNASDGVGSIVVGLIVALISIAWSTFRAAMASEEVLTIGGGLGGSHTLEKAAESSADDAAPVTGTTTPLESAERGAAGGGAAAAGGPVGGGTYGTEDKKEEDEDEGNRTQRWLFHLVMALGAAYLAMLFTNWGTAKEGQNDQVTSTPEASPASMWVRFASQLVVQALYVWILVAGLIFPDRDFGAITP